MTETTTETEAILRGLAPIADMTGIPAAELHARLLAGNERYCAAEPGLPPDGEWAIVELLGHRERRGYVTQVERFGTPLLHIDLAAKLWDGDAGAWEEYAGAALYGMHPTTPAEVRAQWEREKERDRKQREWQQQERARWAALPAGRGEDSGPDEDLDDEDGPAF
jgi:hypothetical protein